MRPPGTYTRTRALRQQHHEATHHSALRCSERGESLIRCALEGRRLSFCEKADRCGSRHLAVLEGAPMSAVAGHWRYCDQSGRCTRQGLRSERTACVANGRGEHRHHSAVWAASVNVHVHALPTGGDPARAVDARRAEGSSAPCVGWAYICAVLRRGFIGPIVHDARKSRSSISGRSPSSRRHPWTPACSNLGNCSLAGLPYTRPRLPTCVVLPDQIGLAVAVEVPCADDAPAGETRGRQPVPT